MNNSQMFEINGVRMSDGVIAILNEIISNDATDGKNTLSETSLLIAACKSDDIEHMNRDFFWHISFMYRLYTAIEEMKRKEGTE